MSPSSRRVAAAALLVAVVVGGCSGGDDEVERGDDGRVVEASDVSVYDLAVGDCVIPPDKVDVEVGVVRVVPCDEAHTQEIFAVLPYEGDDGEPADERATFPGDEVLTAFAESRCLSPFRDYFGIDYIDSALFLTYLVPSVRSWDEEDDRDVVCVAQTTGEELTDSLRGQAR